MARAQHHEAVQTLGFEGEDEPLREGVQVGAPRRQLPYLKKPPAPSVPGTDTSDEFWDGAADGLGCWCEGFANTAVSTVTLGICEPNWDFYEPDPDTPYLGVSNAMGAVSCTCLAFACSMGNVKSVDPGLANPFKGKTPEQIAKMFERKGFSPRGSRPVKGDGGWVNPRTKRSYHIDPANRFNERPHVDVNRTKKRNSNLRTIFLARRNTKCERKL